MLCGPVQVPRRAKKGTRKDRDSSWRIVAIAAAFIFIFTNAIFAPANAASVRTGVTALANGAHDGRHNAPDNFSTRALAQGDDTAPAVSLPQGFVYLDPSHLPAFTGSEGYALIQLRGPLTGEQRATLAALDVRLGEYVHPNAWQAHLSAARLAEIKALDFVYAMSALEDVDKLPAAVLARDFHPRSLNEDGGLTLEVYFHDDVSFDAARAALARVNGTTEQNDFTSGHRITVRIPQTQVLALLALEGVKWVDDREPPRGAHNANAAALSGIDILHGADYGLDGAGIVAGLWDEGTADKEHPDLKGRVISLDGGAVSAHATHVAGTLGGSGANAPSARGMAPGATLLTANYFGDVIAEQRAARTTNGMAVANHSWGYLTGWEENYYHDGRWIWMGNPDSTADADFGSYGSITRGWDRLVADTGLIVVKSSGNDRNDMGVGSAPHYHLGDGMTLHNDWHASDGGNGGYDNIGQMGTAKNVITVGAVDDQGGPVAFSSWGPTDDGRVKPDIVANGVGLYSTYANNGYTTLTGTSMATPVVTGAVALIAQRHQALTGGMPSPHLMKALLANTATDIGNPGPDYAYGFGLLDARAALDTLNRDEGKQRRLIGNTLAGNGEQVYTLRVPENTAGVRITLAWTDPPAAADAAVTLVNDLDLTLFAPDGSVYYPYTLAGLTHPSAPAMRHQPNTVDNIEQTAVTAPAPGLWRVVVKGARVQGQQAYALVSDMPLSSSDQYPPENLALILNGGAPFATSRQITARLRGVDDRGVTGYLLSEQDTPPATGAFIPVSTRLNFDERIAFTLSADEGEKTVYAWLRDNTGNVSPVISARIALDMSVPVAPVISGHIDPANGAPVWTWSGGEGAMDSGQYRFKLNEARLDIGATATNDTFYTPAAPLSAGTHTLYVQTRDAAGNWSAVAARSLTLTTGQQPVPLTVSMMIAAPPSVSAPAAANTALPLWRWTAAHGGIFRYKLDDENLAADTFETNATAYSPAAALPDGIHTLHVRERTIYGDWSAVASSSVLIDTAPPATHAQVSESESGTSWVTLQCEDGGAGCVAIFYTVDGSEPTSASARYTTPLAISPNTTLRFLSLDRAGNMETAQARYYQARPAAATGGGGGAADVLLLGMMMGAVASIRRARPLF